jgi:predicted RNase H-like nuclease
MSKIINKNHSIQLIHIIIFSLDRTIQYKKKIKKSKKITFSKKYSYNGCILVLPSTETHSIDNLIKGYEGRN